MSTEGNPFLRWRRIPDDQTTTEGTTMNRTLRRTSGLAALALTATLGLAACSDDSGDSDSTATDTSSETTANPDPYGQCGWESTNKYYACAVDGAAPGTEDPDGISPIQCQGGLVEGGMCDPMGAPVDGIGCCTEDGVLFYCDQNTDTIVRQDCGQ